ncbi:hypothetical protein Q1695_011443 [Nippostrongylus brasiliensis]|nr:hypothetical protein Q1695_011443 [Nippostrongylus brasiliensis]
MTENETGKRSISHCGREEYQCDSGQCIPKEHHCDRKYDCSDGTDELKCDYFVAASRRREEERGGEPDDGDDHELTDYGSSEHDENDMSAEVFTIKKVECTDQEFRCPYLPVTTCFHYDKLCDGVDDCGDGSDEANCESASQEDRREFNGAQESAAHAAHCSHNEFRCGDGKCIEKSLECDHKYDCSDGTDETQCEYFKEAMSRRAGEERHEDSDRRPSDDRREEEEQRRRAEEERRRHGDGQHEEEELRRRTEELRRREEYERRREEEERRREMMERRREEEERRREEEELRREHENARREEEITRREEAQRTHAEQEHRRLMEERRRQEEERRRQEEERRAHGRAEATTAVQFKEDYDDELPCLDHEFQCHTGECIDKRRLCDTRMDCADGSDESHCPSRPHHDQPTPHTPPSSSRGRFLR